MATEIKYNGGTIASLSAGETATLECNGKKMKSDITVSFDTAGTITYNGEETAVEAGQTATLNCGGKKAVTDIVIVATATQGSDTATLITFTIDGKTYETTEGVTWGEFAEGNTSVVFLNGSYVWISNGALPIRSPNGGDLQASETIINGYNYQSYAPWDEQ